MNLIQIHLHNVNEKFVTSQTKPFLCSEYYFDCSWNIVSITISVRNQFRLSSFSLKMARVLSSSSSSLSLGSVNNPSFNFRVHKNFFDHPPYLMLVALFASWCLLLHLSISRAPFSNRRMKWRILHSHSFPKFDHSI